MATAIDLDEAARAEHKALMFNRLHLDHSTAGPAVPPEATHQAEQYRAEVELLSNLPAGNSRVDYCLNPRCGMIVPRRTLLCPGCGSLSVSSALLKNRQDQERTRKQRKFVKTLRNKGDSRFCLPEPEQIEGHLRFAMAERAGASEENLRKADGMYRAGLRSKGVRQAHCGVLGARWVCVNEPDHKYYRSFRCKNRFCPCCGQAAFAELFGTYQLRLEPVVQRLVPHWPVKGYRPNRVIAKIDITCINGGVMPDSAAIRKFGKDIRRFFRAVEKRFGVSRNEYGVIFCFEFGGSGRSPTSGRRTRKRSAKGNTNLHAHCMYAGPWLPQKNKELSDLWREIRGDGSYIVSVKTARSFGHGLAHALKYAGKVLSKDPARLVELEVAFHGVRRVHSLAAFYNVRGGSVTPDPPCCPACEGPLQKVANCPFTPIRELADGGWQNFDEAKREAARRLVFGESRAGPPWGGQPHN